MATLADPVPSRLRRRRGFLGRLACGFLCRSLRCPFTIARVRLPAVAFAAFQIYAFMLAITLQSSLGPESIVFRQQSHQVFHHGLLYIVPWVCKGLSEI